MTLPKWDEVRLNELVSFVGNEEPVSLESVAAAAEKLGTTPRSIAAKLRKEGYEVEKSSSVATKTFTDVEEASLREFLNDNSGEYTFAEIAKAFAGGKFSAKQVQGKILSMELTDAVKPAEKKVYERKFSDDEQATFIKLANSGAYLEDIADKLNRTLPSVRGKALSLLRAEQIKSIPAAKHVAKAEDAFDGLDIGCMTVEEIAEKTERSPRGVKTMLTRRGLTAKDYDGAAKKEKAAAKA